MGWLRRHAPLVALVVAIAALCLPILLGHSLYLRDLVVYYYPEKLALRARLLAGELPLWDPLVGTGVPALARVQPGVLYPGNVLFLLPRPIGVDLFLAAHLLVTALGMRRWLRVRGCDAVAAALGGTLLALSGYVVAMFAGNGHYLAGAAWVPWALAAAAAPLPAPARAARAALFVALALLAGDPQAAWLAVGLAALQAAVDLDRRGALAVGAAVALAALVTLPQLLAGLETAAVVRARLPLAEASHFSLHPARLLELLWPGSFGEPHTAGWFIHPLYDEGSGMRFEPLASSVYLGLATPWLALLALARRRPARFDVFLAALALAALAVALGRHTPVFAAFFHLVPGASWFRYPEKYAFVLTLALCALAARGLTLFEPRRATAIGCALVAVLGAGAALAFLDGGALAHALVRRLPSGELAAVAARSAALRSLAVGVALLLPVLLAARRPAARSAFAAIAGLELLAAAVPLVGWVPSEVYRARSPVLADLDGLDATRPHRVYRALARGELPGDAEDPALQRATLLPNTGIEDGVDQLDAYAAFPIPGHLELQAALARAPVRLLQVHATRFAFVGAEQLGQRLPPELVVRRSYPGLRGALVEIAGAAPRVYLATDARTAADAAAAGRLLAAADFVPGATAAVEGPARQASGACTLVADAIERLELRCDASAPAYAVVADTWFPGWTAEVNGAAAPILRANVGMRAVPVPSGSSTVLMTYRPRGWPTSLAASVLGIVLVVVLWRLTTRGVRARNGLQLARGASDAAE